MVALATTTDLAAWMGVDESALPAGAATLLDLASAAVRDYCGWTITEETVTDLVVDGTGTEVLTLATMRLTAVTALALWDQTAGTWGDELVDRQDFDWSANGVLTRRRGDGASLEDFLVFPQRHKHWPRWPDRLQSVRLSYTHGWPADQVPAAARTATMAAAARQVTNPKGIRSESRTIGAFSKATTYTIPTSSQSPGLTLTDAETRWLVAAGLKIPGAAG